MKCFNPRAREGREAIFGDVGGDVGGVSIHAPVKGATRAGGRGQGHALVSIHAPVKGATIAALRRLDGMVFQSTRP